MRQDFILDFETIGQNALKCPIIDVAYVVFDWDMFLEQPYSFEGLVSKVRTDKLSVKDQMARGCSFRQSDLDWWNKQSPEARANIKPKQDDLTIEQFSNNIFEYLRKVGKIQYWWSRGNSFDPVILERVMFDLGKHDLMNEYLRWWRVRDIRTYIDAKFNFETKNGFVPVADEAYWNSTFIGHDSKHDIAADILRLQAIHRAENDLPQIDK